MKHRLKLVGTLLMDKLYLRTGTTATPSVSRLTTNRPNQPFENIIANELWTCRLDGVFNSAIPVGIYIRGGGTYSRLKAI